MKNFFSNWRETATFFCKFSSHSRHEIHRSFPRYPWLNLLSPFFQSVDGLSTKPITCVGRWSHTGSLDSVSPRVDIERGKRPWRSYSLDGSRQGEESDSCVCSTMTSLLFHAILSMSQVASEWDLHVCNLLSFLPRVEASRGSMRISYYALTWKTSASGIAVRWCNGNAF